MEKNLEKFRKNIEEKKKLEGALAILSWDLETCTPKAGQDFLSEIVGYLSMKEYNLTTSQEFIQAVETLKNNEDKLNEIEKKEMEIISEQIEKMKNIPADEYQKYSELVIKAQGIWETAKTTNNYSIFKDSLEKIFEYNIKFAKYNRKDEKTLYDVILNDYEKGMTCEKLDIFFNELKKEIVPLLQKIMEKGKVENKLIANTDIEKQKEFSKFLSEYLGFDFRRGVARESEHPFTMDINKNDVRITTKYFLNEPMSGVFSTIHETGHAIYEQAIGDDLKGTILAGGGSMGIHESQSRFYENIIGRSFEFWSAIYKKTQEYIEVLKDIDLDEFYKQINIVTPSLIRTEADELTYSLHILVRYEIEKDIINGKIKADNLPEIWNQKMKEYLGIVPDNFSNGILQDVHWAGGLVGYFPSYALGSAYSAQIFNTMKKELDIAKILKNGELYKIREWLAKKIHKYGKLKDTEEIIKAVTGEGLNPKYYIDYLKEKYNKIYKLNI